MDRSTFLQQAGLTNDQFAGLQVLKRFAYNTDNTRTLQPGQAIGPAVLPFASQLAVSATSNISPSVTLPNATIGYTQGANAIAGWQFRKVTHTDFSHLHDRTKRVH